MAESIMNEQELRRNIIMQICEKFENEITDENIRKYIFDKEGFSIDAVCNTSNYVQYMKNILSLSFYFAYFCYKWGTDNTEDLDNLTKHNSKRIINSLKNAFVKYPITLDLIQFVLTDIQFELQSESSELSNVFGHLSTSSMKNFAFNPYFKIIADFNSAQSRYQYDEIEHLKMFYNLIENMTFLSKYKLVNSGVDEFAFVNKSRFVIDNSYADMKIKHIFFKDDEHYSGGIYHLFSAEKLENDEFAGNNKEPRIRLKYFNLREAWSIVFVIPDDLEKAPHLNNQKTLEILSEISGQALDPDQTDNAASKNQSTSIDQIHTVNYKYIKNLALAISDTISSTAGTKAQIFNRFHKQFPYIFDRKSKAPDKNKEIPPYEDKNLDWDSIVIMLLIEASPSIVLEYIIRKTPSTFDKIVKNLYKRVYDVNNMKIFSLSEEKIKEVVKDIIDEKLIVGESAGFGKITTETDAYNKLFPKAATMLILSKLTIVQESEADESLAYTGNMHSNISLLKNARDNQTEEKKIKYSCIILGETLKHIMCFYAGLFEYGKAKIDYDLLTYDKCFSDNEIKIHQKNLEEIFINAASCEAEKHKNRVFVDPCATVEFTKEFIAFCEKCNPANNSITNNAKNLYAAIGKYEILHIKTMKNYFQKLEDASSDAYNCDAMSWIDTTLKIMEYLKTGSSANTPIDYNLFNAVYPFTAVFDKRNENLDGYKTVNFSLNIDIDDDSHVDYHTGVSVLSEFVYNRNEVYYCLPNVLRSNYKWWIDPVLINFRDFNDIFKDNGKDET